MNKPDLSRIALLPGGLLLLLLAAALFPSWQGNSSVSFALDPALLGRADVSLPEEGWGWEILLPLPLVAEVEIGKFSSLGSIVAGILPGILILVSLLALLSALLAVSLGVRSAGGIFLSAISLLLLGLLFLPLSWYLLSPQPRNTESELVISLLDDLKREVPQDPIVVPGQELISSFSPYFAGSVFCKDSRCQLRTKEGKTLPPPQIPQGQQSSARTPQAKNP